MPKQLVDRQSDVFRDLTQKRRRDITARMKRNGGRAPGGITKLLVRSTLTDFREAKLSKDDNNFRRLQNRNVPHRQATANV